MESILDLSIVNAIRDLGDKHDSNSLLRELLEMFRAQADSGLVSLRAAVESEDFAKLKSSAHRLKGSAANLGAAYLASRCQVLEQIGKAGAADAATLQGALVEVETAVGRSLESLTREAAPRQVL